MLVERPRTRSTILSLGAEQGQIHWVFLVSETIMTSFVYYCRAIFNTGAFIGSAIPLGQNFHAKEMKKVNDGSYIIILVLMTLGFVLALFLAPPEKVIRNDGTRVTKVYFPSVRHELMGLVNTMRYEPFIFSLFPFFWASNWFYTYQFNDMNAYYFNIRTRALNNLMYWFMQIFGALTFGSFLDVQSLSRRSRGAAGWVILFVLVNVIWGGGVPFLQTTARKMPSPNMDLYDDGYAAKLWLYMFFGFLDAMWQTFAYWMMGALSNNPQKLAYYSGIQSAGAAVVWRLDGIGVSFAALYYSSWGLCAGSMLLTALVLAFKITETNITQDDYLTEETNNAQSLTVECPLGTVKEQSPQTKVMEQFDQNTKAF
ncbi:UNC93-like protein [Neolecta irregularis DAH-3]|uniref:UNC93-like protein n=1 Tax=Neolecta irregularis (strain DAH-3) TaxID=1198029 RepID=A0A1U7LHZ5_NEOID|nr:UNC93-like protein [Neolecta irregularis DAH-3]|eukprot:OLL22275.1 UNC93-like protein [Neolecta irregularis DAH-3]